MLERVFTIDSSVWVDLEAFLQKVPQFIVVGKKFFKGFKIIYVSPTTEIVLSFLVRDRIFIKNLTKIGFSFPYHPIRKLA